MALLSQLVDFFLDPANVLAVLVVAAALLSLGARWASRSRRLLRAAALLAVLLWILPLDVWLLRPLEQRFPSTAPPSTVDGIVMLGGAQRPRATEAYGRPALNDQAERMTTFAALARRYPEAKLAFAGGTSERRGPPASEADTVRLFLREQGLDETRVLYESDSSNTWENAVNLERLVRPRQGDAWLIVASAADVPRTVGVFRRVAWTVVPVPVAYQVVPDADWLPEARLTPKFRRIYYGLHEWVGLVAYYVLGRTESLFPAP